MISRNIAYHLRILDINSSQYVKSLGEFESNYIEFKDKKVTRVSIIAVVIDKYETDSYISISIDDGSSQISLKAWNEDKRILDKANIGDAILAIGKIRQNTLGAGFYIQPEIVRKVDEQWLLVRKKELENEYGVIEKAEHSHEMNNEIEIEEVKVSNESLRTRILNFIENMDDDKGVSIDDISTKIKSSTLKMVVDDLVKEGEIFEINNMYKLLK